MVNKELHGSEGTHIGGLKCKELYCAACIKYLTYGIKKWQMNAGM